MIMRTFKSPSIKKAARILQINELTQQMNHQFKLDGRDEVLLHLRAYLELRVWENLVGCIKLKASAHKSNTLVVIKHHFKILLKEVLMSSYVNIDSVNDAFIDISIDSSNTHYTNNNKNERKNSKKQIETVMGNFAPITYA